MNRSEIIRKTLGEMKCPGSYAHIAHAELERRIPDMDFRVCSDFSPYANECCECCHTGYAHYDMHLVHLADGTCAWICCAIEL